MENLRKEAEGRDCQVRIGGVCNKNPQTTVLAHLNNKMMLGAGVGMKVDDIFGAWACSNCHAVVDGQHATPYYSPDEIRAMHYEGVFRTQNILRKEGKL